MHFFFYSLIIFLLCEPHTGGFILPFGLKISVSGKKCLKHKTPSIQSESGLTNNSVNQWKGGGSPLNLMEELMAILDSEAETTKAKQKAQRADSSRNWRERMCRAVVSRFLGRNIPLTVFRCWSISTAETLCVRWNIPQTQIPSFTAAKCLRSLVKRNAERCWLNEAAASSRGHFGNLTHPSCWAPAFTVNRRFS